MPYVYSTLTCDNAYLNYVDSPGLMKLPEGEPIVIKGGHGVADKRLITPLGVATSVSDDELAYLKRNEGFKAHVASGFIVVSDANADPERVAADMSPRDKSSPVVPSDYANVPDGVARPESKAL